MPIEIFISYSHQDEEEKNELLRHLSVLRRGGLFDLWNDNRIGIGDAWKTEIEEALIRARVAILLITKNFLNSDFILEQEVPELLKRHEEGLTIIPIIARDCAWRSVGWLSEIQVFNNGLAIWRDGEAHVDKELTEVTYLVVEIAGEAKAQAPPEHATTAAHPVLVGTQTAASITQTEVSPGVLGHAYNHILFIATEAVGERKTTGWFSWLVQKRKPAEPSIMSAQLYSTIDAAAREAQYQGQLTCQPREDGVIVTTNGDVANLLRFAVRVLQTTKAENGASLKLALHSGEIATAAGNVGPQLRREDIYIARRLLSFGRKGQLLTSLQTADLLRKDTEFASIFHNSGGRTINPPESLEVYNVYKRGTTEDEQADFGNDSAPLREVSETVVRKFNAPHRLRALMKEWVRVTFWPGRSYVKVKFDFKNTDDEKARGVRIYCHKHGDRRCTFEYRVTDSMDSHKPKFRIVAEDPPTDLSLVMEMSCYNEYDELLDPPFRHDIRLLRKPPLPSIKEPLGFFVWLWDRVMRLPIGLRVPAFAALVPMLAMTLYFGAPRFIPKEVKDKLTNDYEVYKRRYWYGYDTYVGDPWEEDFIDASLSHWSFDEGQVKIVKGDGEGNVDTGAMLVQAGDKMVVAGNLGPQAFYDFSAEFRVKFVEGEEADWVFRAQPDRQTGYVFQLKREGTNLVLYGWKYTGPNTFDSIDVDPKRRVPLDSCCYPNDYFDVKAEVRNYTFKYQITVMNFDDEEPKKTRPSDTNGPYPVNDFTDREEKYRFGNAGVLKPPNSKMQVEYWKVTPRPFPETSAAGASH